MTENQYQKFEVLDANTAAATIGYSMSDMCFIYPITPSSSMGEKADDLNAAGKKNIFGNPCSITQMQSEGGVSGALHGAILSGSLCSTFTCSQGLLLMIPEMYKLGGEQQPVVLHVSTRSVGGQAMSIYSDHGDVMATRQAGWGMLCSFSVQQVADFAVIAHAVSIRAQLPVLHFFDGFRVSHEIQKILMPSLETMNEMMDKKAIRQWRETKTMKNSDATMRGLVDGMDEYFPMLEAANKTYDNFIPILKDALKQYAALTGRSYNLYDYYGAPDAKHVVVCLGTACMTFMEYVQQKGMEDKKYGVIAVHLFQPLAMEDFIATIPSTCERITVLDRTKEPGSVGEPLYLEVLAALQQSDKLHIKVHAGRYGLGGRDIIPVIAEAVYNNMVRASAGQESKVRFTVGIDDDVTKLSIPMPLENVTIEHEGVKQALFYGFGADGTVGSVKTAISIIGDNTDLYSQAYFEYDAKKSGGITMSNLRFGPKPITSQYFIQDADYLACHHPSYIRKYNMLKRAKTGGVFVMNGPWNGQAEIAAALPGQSKRTIVEKKLRVYCIDAEKIAMEAGLPGRINMIMQTVFFYLSGILPTEQAIAYLKKGIHKMFIKKGQDVVDMNCAGVDKAISAIVEVKAEDSWANAADEKVPVWPNGSNKFFDDIADPIITLEGGKLKVSDFLPVASGIMPTNTARFEKRNVAVKVPMWDEAKCIQCNQCAYVCPHSSIRAYLVTEDEVAKAPAGFKCADPKANTAKVDGDKPLKFAIGVSTYDCLGCGSCVSVCPVKALSAAFNHSQETEDAQKSFNYLDALPNRAHLMYDENADYKKAESEGKLSTPAPSFKAAMFRRPLIEFSAACAGCAESPIVKVVTQLFGERLFIANACGCSMVWGGYSPSCAYAVNEQGLGPVYTGSLFEDNAELSLGIAQSGILLRDQLKGFAEQIVAGAEVGQTLKPKQAELKEACQKWLAAFANPIESKLSGKAIENLISTVPEAERDTVPVIAEMWTRRDLFQKKSYWAFGGDGWAYDIDFGGLDQVLQMGTDLNILVMDTEVYSNTGGQKSKSTPRSAVARFAAAGKDTKKKDLGAYVMSLGCCYVATVAQGANPQQMVRALHEAEQFPGTSIVIALCPCINWGLKNGQGKAMEEMKMAVQSGYWPLYRYNPLLEKEGKNPLQLDSKAPTLPLKDFLSREVRFTSLELQSKERFEELQNELQDDVNKRYARLAQMAQSSSA
ncbi:Pyruvate:ferredoxin oxidoreductase [Blattamonas nauphoetae]|uniref:Pyruvate:ferredoxin oxidoreductase n=1 Tax=Blattamonas nauphoetae TaxID=2049346 RepID=A0ABQ9XI88_9EUKA|nr:Pyruvate:ferredoxin oxidoreductase [Blattamonas nauphoetae]